MTLSVTLALVLSVIMVFVQVSSASAQTGLVADDALGAHAMLYFDTPVASDDAVFAAAVAEHAGTVRLDIFIPQLTAKPGRVDWSWVDRIARLSRRYRIRVLADLTGMPPALARCPAGPVNVYLCPASDASAWGAIAGQVAARLEGVPVSFEIWNEADGSWTFLGSPAQYGALLAAAVRAIHAADPTAIVMNGGMMGTASAGGTAWLSTALAAAGARTWRALGALNVHVRGLEWSLRPQLLAWRAFAAQHGRPGIPIWVTEAGYPADPADQTDPAFQGGEQAQARYIADALRDLHRASAAKIFVTQRDMPPGNGAFSSEGVIAGLGDDQLSDPNPQPRPAFWACRAFAQETVAHAAIAFAGH
jgi:hypothetical protein